MIPPGICHPSSFVADCKDLKALLFDQTLGFRYIQFSRTAKLRAFLAEAKDTFRRG